jgi:hypothetical protein
MSHSRYYFFGVDGAIHKAFEMGNGHGSAPVLWDYLCRKYIGPTSLWLMDMSRFWTDPDLPARMTDDDRFLLHATYDRVLVPRGEFLRLADILYRVAPDDGKHVNHWPQIIVKLLEFAGDEAVLGMGIYATSVSDDLWQKWDASTEEYLPVDARYVARARHGLLNPEEVSR